MAKLYHVCLHHMSDNSFAVIKLFWWTSVPVAKVVKSLLVAKGMEKKVVFTRRALHMVANDHWKDWGTSSCRYSPLSRPLTEPFCTYIHRSSRPTTWMTCSRNRAWLLFISNLKHHSFGRFILTNFLLDTNQWTFLKYKATLTSQPSQRGPDIP